MSSTDTGPTVLDRLAVMIVSPHCTAVTSRRARRGVTYYEIENSPR